MEQKSVTELEFFQPLLEKMKHYHDDLPSKPENKFRKDGKTPYWTHPVAVADRVRSWGFEQVEPMAALLHDVLEDTIIADCEIFQDLAPHYMKSQLMVVLTLVQAMTKLDWDCVVDGLNERIPKRAIRKSVELERLGMTMDPRVLVIKTADRIENLLTIDELGDSQFQAKYKEESQDLFFTLLGRFNTLRHMYADAIGIYTMKKELMDRVEAELEYALKLVS